MAWSDVLTIDQTKEFDEFGRSHFLSMDGSLDWMWLYGSHKDLAELYPDETWENMRPEVKKKSRLNPSLQSGNLEDPGRHDGRCHGAIERGSLCHAVG